MQTKELNLHVAEVGELFQNEDSFDFLSNQNLLEYDFIIIDTSVLIDEINGRGIEHTKKRFKDLDNFIGRKNLPVVFIVSEEGYFSGMDGNSYSIYDLLKIDVKEVDTQGKKIEPLKDGIFSAFLREYQEAFKYEIGFSHHPGTSIGTARSQMISVSFYTKDYIFLPTFNEDVDIDDEVFLMEIYKIAQSVRRNEDVVILPPWTEKFYLPEEKDKRKNLTEVEKTIIKLEKKRNDLEKKLSEAIVIKQLWTASGVFLENIVQKVFEELGFEILLAESGRSDLSMKWSNKAIVAEIKGLTKSAGEKNAAQLEKWVSSYFSDNGIEAKGILIANTYRELPLAERTEISFPDQMIKYSKQRGHCLVTTLQLCGILLYCRQHPKEKETIISDLLVTEGRFEKFNDWNEFLENK